MPVTQVIEQCSSKQRHILLAVACDNLHLIYFFELQYLKDNLKPSYQLLLDYTREMKGSFTRGDERSIFRRAINQTDFGEYQIHMIILKLSKASPYHQKSWQNMCCNEQIFAIGVGHRVYRQELMEIAGIADNAIFATTGFVGLSGFVKQLAFKICGNYCFVKTTWTRSVMSFMTSASLLFSK